MRTCWKCDRVFEAAGDLSECPACAGAVAFDFTKMRPVDWNKINSFDDLKRLLMDIGIHVDPEKMPHLRKWVE